MPRRSEVMLMTRIILAIVAIMATVFVLFFFRFLAVLVMSKLNRKKGGEKS